MIQAAVNDIDMDSKGILWVQNTSEFIIGVVLVILALCASWFFERQLARLECLVSIGRSSCVSVTDGEALAENYGQLVHLSGQALRPETPIQDPRFICSQLGNTCTRLRTQVQAFQSEGGPRWSEDTSVRRHPALPVGTTVTNTSSVRYGTHFLLPDGLLDQCNDFRSGAKHLGDEVCSRDGTMRFQQHRDGFFYWRPGHETWTAQQVAQEPRVGDQRARFEVTCAGPATILALQVATDQQAPATLLPYRLVPHFPFGEDDKQLRVQEARKSRIGLALEDQICPESRLCCSCNFVAGCCTGVATPEIYRLFEGHRPLDACFAELRKTSSLDVGFGTWTFRLLVLSLLTAGIYMSFSEAFLHVYPVISTMRAASARITSSVSVALAITAAIISVAFFPYKLGKSLIYATLAILFLLCPVIMLC